MNNENKKSKNSGKIILIVLGAVLGLFLLIFGSYAEKEDDDTDAEQAKAEEYSSLDAEKYAEEAEEKIARLCERVSGVDNVSVTVTLAGGYSAVYAQNSQSGSSGYKNEFVLTGNGSSERALLIGYSAPQISGVGIVCSGGGSPQARGEIIALVSAAFGVSSNKIYVAEGKN